MANAGVGGRSIMPGPGMPPQRRTQEGGRNAHQSGSKAQFPQPFSSPWTDSRTFFYSSLL